MNKIRLLALLAAVVVGFGVYLLLDEISQPAETPRTIVVVAAQDIPGKTMITKDMVRLEQVATEALLPGHLEDIDSAVGLVLSSDVYEGEQIVSNRLVLTGTSTEQNDTLAYKLDEGMRAVTVSVGTADTQANMVKPGNCVDIYASYSYEQEVEGEDGDTPRQTVQYDAEGNVTYTEDEEPETETVTATRLLLQNVPVLAVGSVMSKEGSEEEYGTLTLQVTPEDAGILIYAQRQTSLSFVLRSPLDTDVLEQTEVTMDAVRGISDEEVAEP